MRNFKHEKFIYHGYTIKKNSFEYHFSMDEYKFRPRWTCTLPIVEDVVLHELVFNLGMVELISYWKSACPPIVEVRCGKLDEWQIEWWKKLYRNGLGEFFYVNNIVPHGDFMTIIPTDEQHEGRGNSCMGNVSYNSRELSGALIPVGGGKDSIVTLELLRDSMNYHHCYIVGDIKRAYDSAKVAGYPDSQIIKVNRTIDPTLIELNKKGYLNGHTPFSAIIAFSSMIFAYLSGKKYIVLSNESSANEGNISNSEINHQYSKSTEFERNFRDYVNHIDSGELTLPCYFSLLRPWNELQITKKFTQFPKYFPVFQSCNAGTKSNTWCCKCAKCLYVYIMLSAFVDDITLNNIFGENMLENPNLSSMLDALVSPEYDKPFECVGTREEVNFALAAALKKRTNPPFLLKEYGRKYEGKVDVLKSDLLHFFDKDNFVPREFLGKKELMENFWENL